MRKLVGMATASVLLLGVSATGGSGNVAAAIDASLAVKCTVESAKLAGNTASATGFCTRGGKRVGKSQLDWRWMQSSADLSGLACEVGRSAGRGAVSTLKGVSGERLPGLRPTLPGIVYTSFTLQVKGGAGRSKPKTVRKLTPESNIICGKPPAATSSPGATPAACVWSDSGQPVHAVIAGVVTMRAGTVACPIGNGKCEWSRDPATNLTHYIAFGYRLFCENGPEVAVDFFVFFARPKAEQWECSQAYGSMGSFTTPKQWGGGRISVLAVVKTYESKNSPQELSKPEAARVYSPPYNLKAEGVMPCTP